MPTLLKPLRERIPTASLGSTEFVPERRRQRAEAVGSVLRSLVTALILGTALLMILKEFSFDLAPLLASAGIAGVALGFGAQSLVAPPEAPPPSTARATMSGQRAVQPLGYRPFVRS